MKSNWFKWHIYHYNLIIVHTLKPKPTHKISIITINKALELLYAHMLKIVCLIISTARLSVRVAFMEVLAAIFINFLLLWDFIGPVYWDFVALRQCFSLRRIVRVATLCLFLFARIFILYFHKNNSSLFVLYFPKVLFEKGFYLGLRYIFVFLFKELKDLVFALFVYEINDSERDNLILYRQGQALWIKAEHLIFIHIDSIFHPWFIDEIGSELEMLIWLFTLIFLLGVMVIANNERVIIQAGIWRIGLF